MWLNSLNQMILTAAGCLLAAVVIVRVYQWLQRPGRKEGRAATNSPKT